MVKHERGIVVAGKGRFFMVRAPNGDRLRCDVRKKIKFKAKTTPVAVGDDILFSRSGLNDGVIEEVLERRTSFVRPRVGVKEQKQVLAVNLDRLAVVASVKSPPLKTGLIDRCLIAAQAGGLEPIIVFNKIDLDPPGRFEEIVAAYRSITCGVFTVSALDGSGVDELKQCLAAHRTLFTGHSGVGKSTLLNVLIPGLNLRTRKISASSDRGQHATASVELVELPTGGFVVDSPGLKVMGLWKIKKTELPFYYQEFRAYEQLCRFQPCGHIHEPDCAVKAAVEKGKIYRFRYENYLSIAESL